MMKSEERKVLLKQEMILSNRIIEILKEDEDMNEIYKKMEIEKVKNVFEDYESIITIMSFI